MSRARFALHFRSVLGGTPGDLVACRLAEAQELLRQGLALKIIAERVGYGSASALTRAFTRVLGSAPARWLAAVAAAAATRATPDVAIELAGVPESAPVRLSRRS